LIYQWTGQNKIEELVDLGRQRALSGLPRRSPEHRKNLDRPEQWPVTIGQMWGNGRNGSQSVRRGRAGITGDMQRHDADRICVRIMNSL